jgi:glycosyltransferase involved in cell wall biosynthesis
MPAQQVVACNAAYADGGLGKLLAALVDEARARGELAAYFAAAPRAGDSAGHALPLAGLRRVLRARLLRRAPGWRAFLAAEAFDRQVAHRLAPGDVFVGVVGQALHGLRRARQLGYRRCVLVSPNAHVDHVAEQHRRAAAAHPIEPGWLSAAQRRKTLREYAAADEIVVLSEYARTTFVAAGVAAARLRRRDLPLLPRYAPPASWPATSGFRALYVGRLEVTKGVAVLLDAFARLADADAHLTLLGGFASPAMQRWVERATTRDARIELSGGDALPHIHRADVFVHPSYEDGLALAPLEALACGVPVVVTEDTGMKEFVVAGRNGFVVPTGDAGALAERLAAIRARPLRGTFAPFAAAA